MCIPAAARGAPRGCDSGGVTEESVPVVETAWLTMPDLVEVLGEPLGRVRRLLDDRHLIGSKRTGVFAVPEVFVVDGAPLNRVLAQVYDALDLPDLAAEAAARARRTQERHAY